MIHVFFRVLNVMSEVRFEQGWDFFHVLSPLGQKEVPCWYLKCDTYMHKTSLCV